MNPLYLGGAAVLAVLAFMANKRRLSADGTVNLNYPRVKKRDRARGVNARLVDFLDWWEVNGPFPVTIGNDGGLRTDAALQEKLFLEGRSKARYLSDTPHGRGAALDLYPTIDGTIRGLQADPNPQEARELFAIVGQIAKARGFKWGGDFTTILDMPHIELPDWRQVPMPGGLFS